MAAPAQPPVVPPYGALEPRLLAAQRAGLRVVGRAQPAGDVAQRGRVGGEGGVHRGRLAGEGRPAPALGPAQQVQGSPVGERIRRAEPGQLLAAPARQGAQLEVPEGHPVLVDRVETAPARVQQPSPVPLLPRQQRGREPPRHPGQRWSAGPAGGRGPQAGGRLGVVTGAGRRPAVQEERDARVGEVGLPQGGGDGPRRAGQPRPVRPRRGAGREVVVLRAEAQEPGPDRPAGPALPDEEAGGLTGRLPGGRRSAVLVGGPGRQQQGLGPDEGGEGRLLQEQLQLARRLPRQARDQEGLHPVLDQLGRHPSERAVPVSHRVEPGERHGEVAREESRVGAVVGGDRGFRVVPQAGEQALGAGGVGVGRDDRSGGEQDDAALEQGPGLPQRVVLGPTGRDRRRQIDQGLGVPPDAVGDVGPPHEQAPAPLGWGERLRAGEGGERGAGPSGVAEGDAVRREDVGLAGTGRGAGTAPRLDRPPQVAQRLVVASAVAVDDAGGLVRDRRVVRRGGGGEHRGRPCQRELGLRECERQQALGEVDRLSRGQQGARYQRAVGELRSDVTPPVPRRPVVSEVHGGSDRDDEDPPPRWDPDGRPAAQQRAVQLRELVDAFAQAGIAIGVGPDDQRPDEADFLYAKGVVLARDQDAVHVRRVLGTDQGDGEPSKEDGRPAPLSRVDGRPRSGSVEGLTRVPVPAGVDTLEALDRLDRALGPGVATPDHVLHLSPKSSGCPATEPVPSDGPLDPGPAGNDALGRGVRVVVVDSGLLDDVVAATPLLTGVTGDPEPGSVGRYRGHGTFIAGILRAMAPSAEVDVEAFLYVGGGILESDLVPALGRALESVPDVISLSAGATTRHGRPLKSFEVFWEKRLRHHKGTVLVCAAGNDGNRGPFWPAAFPWTVSVGALEKDGSRAPYSNHGSWVDVWARGSDVVAPYPTGDYTYAWPPQVGSTASFTNGLASWCGTSFSTPLVAGLVAARASWSGESARVAARSLVRAARHHATPYVGAVLEPGMADQP